MRARACPSAARTAGSKAVSFIGPHAQAIAENGAATGAGGARGPWRGFGLAASKSKPRRSPRTIAPYHTEERAIIVTSPTTVAVGATNDWMPESSSLPPKRTTRVERTTATDRERGAGKRGRGRQHGCERVRAAGGARATEGRLAERPAGPTAKGDGREPRRSAEDPSPWQASASAERIRLTTLGLQDCCLSSREHQRA